MSDERRMPNNKAEREYESKFGREMFDYAYSMAITLGKGKPDFEGMLKADIPGEHGAINAFIIGQAEPEVVDSTPGVDTESLEKALATIPQHKFSNIKRDLLASRRSYDSMCRTAEERLRNYHQAENERINLFAKIKELEELFISGAEDTSTLADWVKAQVVDPFFSVVGVYKEGDYEKLLIATDRVVLTHVNPEAGVNISVDLGRFLVEVRVSDLSYRVYPYDRNLEAGGHIHPHVNSSGSVCEGEGSSTISTARTSRDLRTLLAVVKGILMTYNAGSPYVSIQSLEAKSRNERNRKDISYLRDRSSAAYDTLQSNGVRGF